MCCCRMEQMPTSSTSHKSHRCGILSRSLIHWCIDAGMLLCLAHQRLSSASSYITLAPNFAPDGTPLSLAASSGHVEAVAVLLEYGASTTVAVRLLAPHPSSCRCRSSLLPSSEYTTNTQSCRRRSLQVDPGHDTQPTCVITPRRASVRV